MSQYKWKLVYRDSNLSHSREFYKNATSKAYLTLKALLKDNDITKDEIVRDIDRVKTVTFWRHPPTHDKTVINNRGIGGKWECRYYRLTPKRAVYLHPTKFTCYLSDLEIWKDY